ncbi:histone deacetylase 6-like isoform X2 [Paramacrobiotus metropolitanus]|uniref:histone deacetylase 6-like isoform X2 n=1 Tax=Paramacrobiotus metropolitanus TaxID=2943436 RepID=UPI0024459232|nr:histone deacetylase 6-like isoform X2 [Paramacrobiotus metropolitanus]
MAEDVLTDQKTAFIYDKDMENHFCPWDPLHAERPERTQSIIKRLFHLGVNLTKQCMVLESRPATRRELQLAHAKELVDTVASHCTARPLPNQAHLKKFSEVFNDVYINEKSYECALIAAGSTLELIEHVANGSARNGLALVRPPGHHASTAECNGFCLFNNVAIGAKYAMEKHGLQRILIVDWDIHHGQGTQRIFYDDKRVLYFSIHRYEEGEFWPNLLESNFDFIGDNEAAGYNINVPLNKTGLGDNDYMAIFQQILLPVAYEFNPQLIIVSAGYDSAIGCPEGRMRVTPAMYGHLTHALSSVAAGKVAVILEGGYCKESLSEGVVCTLEALMGYPCYPLPEIGSPDASVVKSILNVISMLRRYWKNLAFQEMLTDDPTKNAKLLKKYDQHVPRIIFRGLDEELPNEAYGCTPYYPPSEAVEIRHEIAKLAAEYDRGRKQRLLRNRTCVGYNRVMENHNKMEEAEEPLNIDHWQRIRVIHDRLAKAGLLHHCTIVPGNPAGTEDFRSIHSEEYSSYLTAPEEAMIMMTKFQKCNVAEEEKWADDIHVTKGSADAIRCATGCVQAVVDEVVSGRATNGFAVVRPPGHHAHHHFPAGFCFANNVAVAAKRLLQSGALPNNRILIVDWDLHHGDGVQEAFYNDPRVLYISIHLGHKDGKDFYPPGPGKNRERVGDPPGRGYNVNIPWGDTGRTDGDYILAFLQIVMPMAYKFAPDLVLVCCGFDAAKGDFGGCQVTPYGFWSMTRMLMSLAGGKVVLALEGGYELQLLEDCAEAVLRALMGLPCQMTCPGKLVASSKNSILDIKRAINIQMPYWVEVLQYRVILHSPASDDDLDTASRPGQAWMYEDISDPEDTTSESSASTRR